MDFNAWLNYMPFLSADSFPHHRSPLNSITVTLRGWSKKWQISRLLEAQAYDRAIARYHRQFLGHVISGIEGKGSC